MEYKSLVSVLIPAFNHEKYINKAIISVLNQSYQNFEIIIIDDCSTDNTFKKIKYFKDPRIKAFRFNKNMGISFTLNHCIRHAKGKYISLLGSDDQYEKNKLSKQIIFMEKNPSIGAIFSWVNIINQDGNNINSKSELYRHFQRNNKSREEWLNYFFYNNNCLCASSAMIRKEYHIQIGLYDERFLQLQDLDFWIRLLMKYNIHIIPEALVKYRVLNNKINISAERPETINRLSWEKLQILESYLSIKEVKEFKNIFPEQKKFIINKNEIVPKFITAYLSLNETPTHRVFAINTLYKLFKDKKVANKISELHNFSYKELVEIAGRYDLFNNQDYHDLLVKNELYKKQVHVRFFNKITSIYKFFLKQVKI
jgi:glycosyltransferase involved in cell wall biosynthesis